MLSSPLGVVRRHVGVLCSGINQRLWQSTVREWDVKHANGVRSLSLRAALGIGVDVGCVLDTEASK